MNVLDLQKSKALIMVAHPDDETIWMGGVILMNPQVRWTIFSLCRGDDLDRTPKFKKACEMYGARAIISDLEDEGIMDIRDSVPEIERRIKKLLRQKKFDYIFTHGANGEYGHPRHKGVNRAVKNLLSRRELIAKQVFYFAYLLDERRDRAVTDGRAAIKVKLPKSIFQKKTMIIKKVYGFSEGSFEYGSCSRVEVFGEMKQSS